jgi:xanthine dehydrogenase YagS FAD-binding subunit
MKSFAYAAPSTVEDAAALLGDRWGATEIYAGGTDLVTCLKQGLTSPSRVVSLRNISSLRGIKSDSKGIRIGAMTTLAELASNSDVKKHFPALVTAAKGVGSPQLMNVGTVGGDLCQRPRCWYFRNGHGLFGKDGGESLVTKGDNRYHAIFGNEGDAKFVSASSLGPALIALFARITIVGAHGKKREVPAAAFFQRPKTEDDRETALKPNEILAEVFVPSLGLKNATYEIRHRNGLDWPYVSASVSLNIEKGRVSSGSVVLGHVAPVPWDSADASIALRRVSVNESVATKVGQQAVLVARPLSGNAYKIQLVKTAVKRAVLAAAAA